MVTTVPRPWPHQSLALTAAVFSALLGDTESLMKTWKARTKVASYLSWHPQHLQNLMVNTDNAKSKHKSKKLTRDKGCTIESLEAPDFK